MEPEELTEDELDQVQYILEAKLEFYLQAYAGEYNSGTMQRDRIKRFGPGIIKRNGEYL